MKFATLLILITILFSCREKTSTQKYMQIALKNGQNETVRLADYKEKYLIVDFWASWCGPCQDAVPVLERLKKESDSSVFRFIGVNTDTEKTRDRIIEAAGELGISYDIMLDPALVLSDAFKVDGIPALFILNRKGDILFMQYGLSYTDYPRLKAFLNKIEKG